VRHRVKSNPASAQHAFSPRAKSRLGAKIGYTVRASLGSNEIFAARMKHEVVSPHLWTPVECLVESDMPVHDEDGRKTPSLQQASATGGYK